MFKSDVNVFIIYISVVESPPQFFFFSKANNKGTLCNVYE